MKKQIIIAVAASFIPAIAFAGPSLGIAYSNVGLSGHAGRPGVQITAGNLYRNNVVASGSATFARGYYGFRAGIGKLIPSGGVSFEPNVSLGFINLDYNQAQQPQTIQNVYGLAGVNLNVPIDQRVALKFGGGFGHTLTAYSGGNGMVYQGKAEIGCQIAPRVTASIDVRYLHIPGASMTTEGAGLAYQF